MLSGINENKYKEEVYPATQVYTKAEVDALITQQITSMLVPCRNAIKSVIEALKGMYIVKVYDTLATYPKLDLAKAGTIRTMGVGFSQENILDKWNEFMLTSSFSAWYRTYVYLDEAYTFSTYITTDDGACLYLNEQPINEQIASTVRTAVTIPFTAGWNTVDVLYTEGSGGDGFYFDTKNFNTLSQVRYAGAIQFDISLLEENI